jgi:hypothetical protein
MNEPVIYSAQSQLTIRTLSKGRCQSALESRAVNFGPNPLFDGKASTFEKMACFYSGLHADSIDYTTSVFAPAPR